jgi:hypothetical protein
MGSRAKCLALAPTRKQPSDGSTQQCRRSQLPRRLTEPDLVARTDYQGFLDTGEGRIPFDEFATRHLEIINGAAHTDTFLTLMSAAMTRPG